MSQIRAGEKGKRRNGVLLKVAVVVLLMVGGLFWRYGEAFNQWLYPPRVRGAEEVAADKAHEEKMRAWHRELEASNARYWLLKRWEAEDREMRRTRVILRQAAELGVPVTIGVKVD